MNFTSKERAAAAAAIASAAAIAQRGPLSQRHADSVVTRVPVTRMAAPVAAVARWRPLPRKRVTSQHGATGPSRSAGEGNWMVSG